MSRTHAVFNSISRTQRSQPRETIGQLRNERRGEIPGNPHFRREVSEGKRLARRDSRALETCSVCPVTMTGEIASRHVKGQRADDPHTEPANSNPPGLATTMRMAARPSSCLQQKPAAPFDLSAESSICGCGQALELLPFAGALGSVVVGPRSCITLRAKAVTVRLTWRLSTFTRSVLRIRALNGRPFATSHSRSSRVRFSDFLALAVPVGYWSPSTGPSTDWIAWAGVNASINPMRSATPLQ